MLSAADQYKEKERKNVKYLPFLICRKHPLRGIRDTEKEKSIEQSQNTIVVKLDEYITTELIFCTRCIADSNSCCASDQYCFSKTLMKIQNLYSEKRKIVSSNVQFIFPRKRGRGDLMRLFR